MATNIPLTGKFKVTCEFKRKGKWAAGYHTGIDLVSDNDKIYSSCDGEVVRTGYDKSYGNYVVVKNKVDGKYHWFCHLSKINTGTGKSVKRTTVIGIMGNTGNSTGKHLHFEIRNISNKYGDVSNPAEYMGIPNSVGTYNSSNYTIKENINNIKVLAKNTNLRNKPTLKNSTSTLYLKNTTVCIINPAVTVADGYTWDYVRIKANSKTGYMINKNYK